MRTRTHGRWIGLAAGVLGFVGWIFALGVAFTSGFQSRAVVFFVVMLLAIGGVGLGAYRSDASSRTIWRLLLGLATLLLVCGTVLSGFTVGLLFAPAALLALVATLLTNLGRATRTA